MSGKCEPGYKVHYSHTAGRFSVHSHFSMVAPCNALRKKSWSLAVTDIYLSFIYHIPCSLCLPVNSCGASKRYHYQPLPRWSWKEGEKKYAHEAWWSKNNSSQERTAHAHTQTYKGGRNDAAVGKRREQVWPTRSALCVWGLGLRGRRGESGRNKRPYKVHVDDYEPEVCKFTGGHVPLFARQASVVCANDHTSGRRRVFELIILKWSLIKFNMPLFLVIITYTSKITHLFSVKKSLKYTNSTFNGYILLNWVTLT